jgi:hypothetical protein
MDDKMTATKVDCPACKTWVPLGPEKAQQLKEGKEISLQCLRCGHKWTLKKVATLE